MGTCYGFGAPFTSQKPPPPKKYNTFPLAGADDGRLLGLHRSSPRFPFWAGVETFVNGLTVPNFFCFFFSQHVSSFRFPRMNDDLFSLSFFFFFCDSRLMLPDFAILWLGRNGLHSFLPHTPHTTPPGPQPPRSFFCTMHLCSPIFSCVCSSFFPFYDTRDRPPFFRQFPRG